MPEKLHDDRYLLLEPLGRGGSGLTWLARDMRSGATVVIKELFVDLTGDAARYEREASVLSQLRHERIPRFVEVFVEPVRGVPRLHVVMERVVGISIEEERKTRRYRASEAVELVREVLRILVYLQDLSPPLVHRDVKPSNLMRRAADGAVVLLDFGLAVDAVHRTFGHTMAAGTLGYQAPEQIRGEPVPASDVYSAGVLLWTLLTRIEPHTRLEGTGLDWRPSAAHLPPRLVDWLERCLAPVERRFPTAAAALEALDRVEQGGPRAARVEDRVEESASRPRHVVRTRRGGTSSPPPARRRFGPPVPSAKRVGGRTWSDVLGLLAIAVPLFLITLIPLTERCSLPAFPGTAGPASGAVSGDLREILLLGEPDAPVVLRVARSRGGDRIVAFDPVTGARQGALEAPDAMLLRRVGTRAWAVRGDRIWLLDLTAPAVLVDPEAWREQLPPYAVGSVPSRSDYEPPAYEVPLVLSDGSERYLGMDGTLFEEAGTAGSWPPGYYCGPDHGARPSCERTTCLSFASVEGSSRMVLGEEGTWPQGGASKPVSDLAEPLLRPGLVRRWETECALEIEDVEGVLHALVVHDATAVEPKRPLLSLVSTETGRAAWTLPVDEISGLAGAEPLRAAWVDEEIHVLLHAKKETVDLVRIAADGRVLGTARLVD